MPTLRNPSRYHQLVLALAAVPLLMGGACEKKSTKSGDTGAINALDRAGSDTAPLATGPVDTAPLDGIDVSKLEGDKLKLFYKLVGSYNSPCGKAHSLRTSYTTDTSCKRAPFAVRYVLAMIEDEAAEETIREYYTGKYAPKGGPVKLDVSKAPRAGNEDAPIRLVEFFDYACPHCAAFSPVMEAVMSAKEGKVVEYFLMYPLEGKHPDSKSAAQAALAAQAQGKFKEMHAVLFAKSPQHGREAVMGYAKELGLDMGKFETDYTAAAAQIAKDQKQGEAGGVESTPTLFFNDRKYEGPMVPKYIGMWIDEELAVNR
ncbi:MAG: thioredoxin domain-containing protein [Deltaproteobacteria bacterium]|nr:thioredoxin domain-containing protein [Deltaproteobacteria bacterium]